MFRSDKTGLYSYSLQMNLTNDIYLGRGPLSNDWFEQLKKTARKESMMCAYKLCRAEFRYWGMQSRCERFIHEIGRNT